MERRKGDNEIKSVRFNFIAELFIMKVGLMTLESQIYNYGGMLQEYALYKFIENEGHSCKIIDYDKSTDTYVFSLKSDIRNFTFRKIIKKIKNKSNQNYMENEDLSNYKKIRANKFDEFRKKIKYTERCGYNNVYSATKELEVIFCGSDQIWNPDYAVKALFLNFCKDHQVPVIYAASMGKSYLSKGEKQVMKELLEKLDNISVREHSAKTILSPLTKSNIEVVLDPTLLMTKEFWDNECYEPLIREDYVLCYFLGDEVEKRNIAIQIASKLNLRLVTIPYIVDSNYNVDNMFGMNCIDEVKDGIGPVEFITLIKNAKLILSDSFHASVFSIIFNKPFKVFGRDYGKDSMNSRIDNLLDMFDCKECYTSFQNFDLNSIEVEDEVVYKQEKYVQFKEVSVKYLRKFI